MIVSTLNDWKMLKVNRVTKNFFSSVFLNRLPLVQVFVTL